jgi:hypothetical protein
MWRKLAIVGVVLGVLLAVGAGLIRWVAAPALAVLPGDTDTTRTYEGKAAVLLNAAALTSGGQVLLTDVPITVTHRTRVLDTDGDNALVSDARTVKAGGNEVAGVVYRYAVNRTDLGRGSGFDDVVKQTGLTFNWPIRTEKRAYTGWVPDTQSTTQLSYKGTQGRGGVDTYVFTTTTTQAAPITDPQVLKALPASLPKPALASLVGGLGLSAAQLQAFQQLLPTLPDPVPFAYTYQVQATYWVAPDSGIVVDLDQHETRSVALATGTTMVPITPVMDLAFKSTPDTLAAAADDARNDGRAVSLLYQTLPLGLVVAGGFLILLGVVVLAAGRRGPRGRASSTA